MASTIYYGKSTTEGSASVKQVELVNGSLGENFLQEGDILLVYFTEGLEVDNPRLVLSIGDINDEISTITDQGIPIYNAKIGDWSAGETVTFIYASEQDIIKASNNIHYWKIVAHNNKASSEVYGGVLIDADDSSAASIGKVKNLIFEASSTNSLSYKTIYTGSGMDVAYLTLSSTNNNETVDKSVTISIPTYPNVPASLSDFADNNEISLDNATKLGYLNNDNFQTIIDLKEDNTSDVRISSPNNIYLTVESLQEQPDKTIAVGKSINDNSYALAIGETSLVEVPRFTVDWSGRIQCGDYQGNLKSIFDIFYPVGSYYETDNSNFNPNTAWGGTWELESQGRVHIGSGPDYLIKATGGTSAQSYTPTGTVGNHKLTVSEIPSHTHVALQRKRTGVDDFLGGSTAEYGTAAGSKTATSFDDYATYITSSTGGSGNHNHSFTGTATSINIMQPYVVVNRWHRTA